MDKITHSKSLDAGNLFGGKIGKKPRSDTGENYFKICKSCMKASDFTIQSSDKELGTCHHCGGINSVLVKTVCDINHPQSLKERMILLRMIQGLGIPDDESFHELMELDETRRNFGVEYSRPLDSFETSAKKNNISFLRKQRQRWSIPKRDVGSEDRESEIFYDEKNMKVGVPVMFELDNEKFALVKTPEGKLDLLVKEGN